MDHLGENGHLLISGFDIEGLPSAVWPGGETEALTRIERHLERKVSDFHPFPFVTSECIFI